MTGETMSVAYVDGLAKGEVIQFAIGDWRDGSARGVTVSDGAFDSIEPAFRRVLPTFDRYGVTPISGTHLPDLIKALQALAYDDALTTTMIDRVIDWLTENLEKDEQVTVLGL